LARSGIRTLGAFGTHRTFPSRACIAARGSAGMGRIDHHPRFRRVRDYRHAQPREARPAISLGDRTTLASGPSRHREHPVAPNHATGASCPFSPPVMERWIV
jgi:hypothetical protein